MNQYILRVALQVNDTIIGSDMAEYLGFSACNNSGYVVRGSAIHGSAVQKVASSGFSSPTAQHKTVDVSSWHSRPRPRIHLELLRLPLLAATIFCILPTNRISSTTLDRSGLQLDVLVLDLVYSTPNFLVWCSHVRNAIDHIITNKGRKRSQSRSNLNRTFYAV